MGAIDHISDNGEYRTEQLLLERVGSSCAVPDFSKRCTEMKRKPQDVLGFMRAHFGPKVRVESSQEELTLLIGSPYTEEDVRQAWDAYTARYLYCEKCGSNHTRLLESRLQGGPRIYICCIQDGCMHDRFLPTKQQAQRDLELANEMAEYDRCNRRP